MGGLRLEQPRDGLVVSPEDGLGLNDSIPLAHQIPLGSVVVDRGHDVLAEQVANDLHVLRREPGSLGGLVHLWDLCSRSS